jgi:phosphatidylinositol-3-phosphatase
MKKIYLMKRGAIRTFLGCVTFLAVAGVTAVVSAQTRTIRIVAYNIQADTVGIDTPGLVSPSCGLIVPDNSPNGVFNTNCTGSVTNGGVLEGIGEEIMNGDPAQPIDVLALEETTSNTETVQPIVDGLNAFYSYYSNAAGYAMSPYQATEEGGDSSGGNGPNAMVYNTNTLQLIASIGVGTPEGSGNGEYRQVVRYEFAPAGIPATTNNEFYVYVSHYKADSGAANEADRLGEATIIRDDEASNLPVNSRVLYVGDYNPDNNSGEPAYQTICSNSAPNGIRQGQGVDPLNILWGPYTDASTTINWSSSTTSTQILFMLTEHGYELEDRDDLQIMTSNVYYDVAGGLQYVPGTYHAFGNNGTTPYYGSVSNVNNTALNDLDPRLTNILSVAELLEDLTGASDHLPVVADYTIPVPAAVQNIRTVFIVMMANENWASISGNAAAPYINNGLLPMSSYALQYYNPPGNHPDLPNYLWLEAGTNFGITADGPPSTYSQTTTNHLVTLLKNAGISWTSYQEDIGGTVCALTATNQYVPNHDPMVYFDDVTNTNSANSAYCVANVQPFTDLAGNLQSNVVTRYNFITPNLCDDMDGDAGCLTGNALITQGDTWLSNTVSTIMSSQAYSNDGVIFITWDQGQGGDGPIGMIVVSPLAKGGGYSNNLYYTHSSTLLTMQEIFNVGPLLGGAANAADLSDLFIFGSQLAVSPASGLTSTGGAGGPFVPSSQTYTLSNTGGVAMVWSVTNTFNWLTLSATSGTLPPYNSISITVSINSNANSLVSGSYSDAVVFATSNGSGSATEPISLTVNNAFGNLTVIPSTGFSSGGPPGGPFSPVSQTYTLNNNGGAALIWTANNSSTWLTISPTSGTLAAGASTNVTATINANANSLTEGDYADTIGFTNTESGSGNTTRSVALSVFGFYDNFSTFSSGSLVGQSAWTQLGSVSSSPIQIAGGQTGFTGGLTNNSQTAYKNFSLTNETVFYGLTLTVTNTPVTNTAAYFVTMYSSSNATGNASFRLVAGSPNSAKTNYVLGVKITPAANDPFTFGTKGLSYGTQYRVIVEAVGGGGTNVIVYVNPTSGTLGAQTPYTNNVVATGITSVGSVAIAQQGSGTSPSAGGLIGKFVVSDNFGIVYDDLLGTPTASFTANPTNGVAPLNVAFTDTSSNSPTSWAWTFGDGGTSTAQNPNYMYTVPGTYTVTLVASNAGGPNTNTQVNLITVLPAPPVAGFMASPISGAAPLTVSFADQSSGSVTGWAWTFGDGNTSISPNPSDIYLTPGIYTVQEIVSGPGGSSTDTVANLISVYDPFAWWQQSYGITNCALCAGSASYTGDGMSNTNKFMAGFNPTNTAAYLHIISIVRSAAGNTNVVVTYLGANGDNSYVPGIASRTNVLDYTPGDIYGNYTDGSWQDTGQTNILSGGNGFGIVTNMTDTATPGTVTNRYYRVRVLLP